MREEDVWDFFISYTQSDRAWAEWLAWELEVAGYSVRLQAWDMPAGSSFVHEMDQALQHTRMAEQEATRMPDWPVCDRSGCIGVPWDGQKRCLAHVDSEIRKTILAALEPGAELDLRGTPIDVELLNQLLAALRPDDGPPNAALRPVRRGAVRWERRVRGGAVHGDARFDGARFHGAAGFEEARFEGAAGFDSASFHRDTEFRGATFHRDAQFTGVTSVFFHGNARFDGAIFQGDAWFKRARFRGATGFEGAYFEGAAGFEEASFQLSGRFIGAYFEGAARFDKARFDGDAWFDRAGFQGPTRFGPLRVTWTGVSCNPQSRGRSAADLRQPLPRAAIRSGGRRLQVRPQRLQTQALLAGSQLKVEQHPDQHAIRQGDRRGHRGRHSLAEPAQAAERGGDHRVDHAGQQPRHQQRAEGMPPVPTHQPPGTTHRLGAPPALHHQRLDADRQPHPEVDAEDDRQGAEQTEDTEDEFFRRTVLGAEPDGKPDGKRDRQ
jgi:hypothetical protein